MTNIEEIISEYQSLNLHTIIDYDKFNQYAIVHHSSTIEGSALTENETRLLLEEGVTPKGKPLEHSLMVKDHFTALKYVIEFAGKKLPVTVDFIQAINASVMHHTGNMYKTVLGDIDASKGMFRKGNVSAGGSYFVNYDKVEAYTHTLVKQINNRLTTDLPVPDCLKLSFTAHFDLVSINPFYDGNGRTSRLLMNYIQEYFKLPLAIVYKEDKADYFTALQESRKKEDTDIFIAFMMDQYSKLLKNEIQQYRKDISQDKGMNKGGSLSVFF